MVEVFFQILNELLPRYSPVLQKREDQKWENMYDRIVAVSELTWQLYQTVYGTSLNTGEARYVLQSFYLHFSTVELKSTKHDLFVVPKRKTEELERLLFFEGNEIITETPLL